MPITQLTVISKFFYKGRLFMNPVLVINVKLINTNSEMSTL